MTSTKPAAKGGAAAASNSGASDSAPLPFPANTVNSEASVASDDGTETAIEGQPVMNPGVTSEPATPKPGSSVAKAHRRPKHQV